MKAFPEGSVCIKYRYRADIDKLDYIDDIRKGDVFEVISAYDLDSNAGYLLRGRRLSDGKEDDALQVELCALLDSPAGRKAAAEREEELGEALS